MDIYEKLPVVYTAYSKRLFYAKMLISTFCLKNDKIPLNPFSNWDYYMNDMVERPIVVRGNNNLITLSQQLWIFGEISDGVLEEIKFAKRLSLPISYFTINKTIDSVKAIRPDEVKVENELLNDFDFDQIMKVILNDA